MVNPVPPSGALVATQALREHLDELMGRAIHVGTRKPVEKLSEFIVVSRIGGEFQRTAHRAQPVGGG